MFCHSTRKPLHQRLLPTVHQFLNLSDREFVFLIVFISLHTLVKQGDVKTASVLKRLPCSLALVRWFCEQVGRRNKEMKNVEIEEGAIGGDCRDGDMNK